MRFAAVLLACASTAFAYTITSPGQNEGWTDQGSQRFTWTSVSSDRANFTAVLTNTNRTLLPSDQVLAALVDGSLGNFSVGPPSAGWPSPGGGYILNFVASATQLSSILAQSTQFTITHSTVIPTSSKTSAAGSSTGTGASGSQPTDTTTGGSSGALSNFGAPLALSALAALVPAILL